MNNSLAFISAFKTRLYGRIKEWLLPGE